MAIYYTKDGYTVSIPVYFYQEQTGIVGSNKPDFNPISMEWEMSTGVTDTSRDPNAFQAPGRKYYNEKTQFIKLDQSFNAALKEKNNMAGYDEYRFVEAMRMSANILLKCRPDKVSVQLTEDNSIFYTLIVGSITIYFEHYPMSDLDELDEVVLTIYNDKENILSVSGEMHEVITAANGILQEHNIAMPVLA
jgi:hypothetical protein